MRSGSSRALPPQGDGAQNPSATPSTPPAAGRPGPGRSSSGSRRGGAARSAWAVAVPLFALALAVLFLATSGDITGREGSYPRVLAGVVVVLALLSLVRDHADARRESAVAPTAGTEDEDDPDSEAASFEGGRGVGVAVRRVLAFAGVSVLAVYLMSWLGFFIPAALLVAGGVLVLGIRSPWRVVVFTVALVGIAHLLFVEALKVPFPTAPWS